MTYSKKRMTAVLSVLAVAWILILTGPMYEDVSEATGPILQETFAQTGPDDNCPNTNGPCAFPAENYNGGVILGASFIEGTQIALFNPDGASGAELQGAAANGETASTYLPPDAADKGSNVESVKLGLDVGSVDDFFFYKTWKTGGAIPDHDDVYAYIETDNATLDGPSGSGNDCTSDDGIDGYNPDDCDLTAEVVELSAGRLCVGGSGTLAGIGARDDRVFFGGKRPADKQRPKTVSASEFNDGINAGNNDNCNEAVDTDANGFSQGCAVNTDPDCEEVGYWTPDPQDDRCGSTSNGADNDLGPIVALDLIGISADLQGFCLFAADPEATYIGQDFSIDRLQIDDLLIRSHRIEAQREDQTNKELRLNNFYAEIRWGKGHDRASLSESGAGFRWPDVEYQNQFEGSKSSALANPFPCEGNRFSDSQGASWGDNNCFIDTGNSGNLQRGSYDDIYR
jgi:hypothetical protein